jgi:hypothetical protein
MKGKRKMFTGSQVLSSVFMILALGWLTISIPFVNRAKEIQKSSVEQSGKSDRMDNNPFGGINEEKTESGVSMLSEYLHETTHTEHAFQLVKNKFKYHQADTYFAFHPELVSPPPETLAS